MLHDMKNKGQTRLCRLAELSLSLRLNSEELFFQHHTLPAASPLPPSRSLHLCSLTTAAPEEVLCVCVFKQSCAAVAPAVAVVSAQIQRKKKNPVQPEPRPGSATLFAPASECCNVLLQTLSRGFAVRCA